MQTAGGCHPVQRRSTTIEPVRVYMRVPGTQPMPRLVRLVQDIEAAGFDGARPFESQLLSPRTVGGLAPGGHPPARPTLSPPVPEPPARPAPAPSRPLPRV